LADFAGCLDAETIAVLLYEKHETPKDTSVGGEEEDFKLEDDDHQMIDDPQLLLAITPLCLDAWPEDLIESFSKLQESSEWQCAGMSPAQIAMIV
jgi:hypothetical protein